MTSKKTLFLFALALLATVLTVACILLWTSRPKTAYVNTVILFEQFALKKDLEKKYSQTENARKAILDSLQQNLILLSSQAKMGKPLPGSIYEKYNSSRENFFVVKAKFEEDNQLLSESYNDQIWTRINEYVKEYGERNNYTYIYGANGGGSLMYANSHTDITQNVIEYINKRYQGDLK